MQIEIAESSKMSQSGSSLFTILQDKDMPVLDLLVRESIQNSLDAASNDSEKPVKVEFLTGKFNKEELNSELDKVTKALNKKYPNEKYNYIAIRDSGTEGLTGKTKYEDVQDNIYGNFIKLVYDISKAQDKDGAGGSWGLGKTVYFRVGIGLVLYYSRIVNENGEYESRLAATMVEDENSKNAIIPKKGGIRRGIAWWGLGYASNKTCAITDEQEIAKILKIFDIPQYSNSDTGTTIIIPYIDHEKLLSSNQVKLDEENNFQKSWWKYDVKKYLSVSIQKWYGPRLNNKSYNHGKYLNAYINGNLVGVNSNSAQYPMEPVFRIIRDLYNRVLCNEVPENDFFKENKIEDSVFTEEISIHKVMENSTVGWISYAKVKDIYLGVLPPDNKPIPACYCISDFVQSSGEIENNPIVCFTRKPGMIVSYKDSGDWVKGIKPTSNDEYIIGIFVLNSKNVIKNANMKLEQYVRNCEKANHAAWNDVSIGAEKPNIVSLIKYHSAIKINKKFSEDVSDKGVFEHGLGHKYGKMLLPPLGFGHRPTTKGDDKDSGKGPKGTTSINNIQKSRDVVMQIDVKKTQYNSDTMTMFLNFNLRKATCETSFVMDLYSENGAISLQEWEDMGMECPFEIESLEHNFIEKENDSENSQNINISSSIIKTANAKGFGGLFVANKPIKGSLDVKVVIKIYRRDLSPVFQLKKNEINGDVK